MRVSRPCSSKRQSSTAGRVLAEESEVDAAPVPGRAEGVKAAGFDLHSSADGRRIMPAIGRTRRRRAANGVEARASRAGSASRSSMGRGRRQLQFCSPTVAGVLMRSGTPSSSCAERRARGPSSRRRGRAAAPASGRARPSTGRRPRAGRAPPVVLRQLAPPRDDGRGVVRAPRDDAVGREARAGRGSAVVVLLPRQHAVAGHPELAQHVAHERAG